LEESSIGATTRLLDMTKVEASSVDRIEEMHRKFKKGGLNKKSPALFTSGVSVESRETY
jgi:hypothetical protein